MNIELEHVNLIPTILKHLERLNLPDAVSNSKRWLNTKELADYIGYSIESVNKMVKEQVFMQDIHYYKPSKRLLFDKAEIDNWVVGLKSEKNSKRTDDILQSILNSMKED